MTDRIIEIAETSAFLSLENHLLKIRFPVGNIVSVPVKEIQCLIISNPAITITGSLLAALADSGCIVLISDEKHLPQAMQIPLEGNYIQTQRFLAQINAPKPLNKQLWKIIVQEKIKNQAALLQTLHQNDYNLFMLAKRVKSGDTDNMEGRAAAIYWKHLFEKKFCRDRDLPDNNLLLNYGYAVLRAITARACCAAGLHPTLGLNHHNQYNAFCLADDLMEPFRPAVDQIVYHINLSNQDILNLSPNIRRALIQGILESKIPTKKGYYCISDFLHCICGQLVRSFLSQEVLLDFSLSS